MRRIQAFTTIMLAAALALGCDPATGGSDGGVPGDGAVVSLGPVRGFTPETSGFAFQNYTNDVPGLSNLTPTQMRQIFGDGVCARISAAGECELKPTAREVMDFISRSMGGGHCEGMAVLSLLMHQGVHSPSSYGAATVPGLTLAGNPALQNEIGRYFAFQFPLSMARMGGTPNEQVERLRASFADGSTENYTIAFFKPDRTGGHAVTPYGITDNGDGTVSIDIYDNNFPAQRRAIVVNTAANSWSYEAAATPGNPASLYQGDASTNTLQIVPLSARLAQQPCEFCGNVGTNTTMRRTVASTGQADVLITDDAGHRMGRMDGALINEIPGADAVAFLSDDLWADDQDPLYRIPAGSELTVEVSGGDLDAAEPTSVSLSGPGYVLGVEDIQLEPGQLDTVIFGRDTPEIYYQTDGQETAEVGLAIETEAADWGFYIRSRGDSSGQVIEAAADFENGEIFIAFDGADAESEFDLLIERDDDDGLLEFYHPNVVVPNGAALYVTYQEFDVDGEQLVLLVDLDGDDVIDEEIPLTDDAR
ncbi:MAG: hypothetical protein KC619_22615 [Myxococcales bacterium]|nr:hypothetical protein [Myxococcales bacterium]